jgi:hypothetical protein
MPILTQHFILLQRNLPYTGITRERARHTHQDSVALAIAVRNNKPHSATRLKERLMHRL